MVWSANPLRIRCHTRVVPMYRRHEAMIALNHAVNRESLHGAMNSKMIRFLRGLDVGRTLQQYVVLLGLSNDPWNRCEGLSAAFTMTPSSSQFWGDDCEALVLICRVEQQLSMAETHAALQQTSWRLSVIPPPFHPYSRITNPIVSCSFRSV